MKPVIFMLIPFMGIIAILFSCRSSKVPPENYADKQIRFGSGGGFTGMVKEYALLDNGYIYEKHSLEDTYTLNTKVSRKKRKKCFAQARQLSLSERVFSHPGNRYYFIDYQDSMGQNRITWGDMQHTLDPALIALYDQLNDLVKSGQ